MPLARRRTAAPDDDAALAAQVAARDGAALERLYRREAGAVYRYVLALAGNPAWAADATQEAFVALAERRAGGFDAGRGSLAAYLAGVARHHLLALWRARPLAEDEATEAADPGLDPEAMLVQRQSVQSVRAALARLPWPQREAIVLVDLQQRPYAEAAAIAGAELNTLRTRLHRGRAQLARLLSDDAGAGTGARP
ncbi:MAG TPA: RNA polymerase sigma factor [Burkholderiaceae bacterium]|nr:RNA polymerase sigma factor [Burkholderiaceae bacterium]